MAHTHTHTTKNKESFLPGFIQIFQLHNKMNLGLGTWNKWKKKVAEKKKNEETKRMK